MSVSDFSFSIKPGMVIETTVGAGASMVKMQGVVIDINDMEIVFWPINNTMQQTQMQVIARSTAQYSISRPARPEELVQAHAGVTSIMDNYQKTIAPPPAPSPDPVQTLTVDTDVIPVTGKPVWS